MVLSDALRVAAKDGDLDTVQEWLAGGGDPDDRSVGALGGETLLHVAAGAGVYYRQYSDINKERGRCAIVSALLAAGATIDAVSSGVGAANTPLLVAAIYGRTEMVEILCQAGADVNQRPPPSSRPGPPSFPLCVCLQYPDIVRVLLRFGADPSMKCSRDVSYFRHDSSPAPETVLPEEKAEREASSHWQKAELRESARLCKDMRLLRPRLRGVFALRALCTRGRAWPTPATPAAFVRLIGGGASRPRTRAAAKVPASPGLPDPLAHLVCKFWLGEPPRRRAAAAAPTSE